jgi:hypothetical protein
MHPMVVLNVEPSLEPFECYHLTSHVAHHERLLSLFSSWAETQVPSLFSFHSISLPPLFLLLRSFFEKQVHIGVYMIFFVSTNFLDKSLRFRTSWNLSSNRTSWIYIGIKLITKCNSIDIFKLSWIKWCQFD